MLKKLFAITPLIACFCCTSFAADQKATSTTEPSSSDIDKMIQIHQQASRDGHSWRKVEDLVKPLYRDLRLKGHTRHQAIHDLRRVALPSIDIEEFGKAGQEIRTELTRISASTQRIDKVNEQAAIAATALTFNDLLATFIAVEVPTAINLAIAGEDGMEAKRRTEALRPLDPKYTIVKFTEPIPAQPAGLCTVDTLRLGSEVHFSVTCTSGEKSASFTAASSGDCSMNSTRQKPVELSMQTPASGQPMKVWVWCSAP